MTLTKQNAYGKITICKFFLNMNTDIAEEKYLLEEKIL